MPRARVGDVLARVKDDVLIEDLAVYSRVTIRVAGKGVDLRDKIEGIQIGTKRQFIARKGQFILSKIDARNGAFGLIPASCDNAIVTGNFWVFDIDSRCMEARYFDYLTKTAGFVEACRVASDGTTNRRYLQEEVFLGMEIPLPPLPEQRAIVARLDALAGKSKQVAAHLDTVEANAEQLLAQQFAKAIANAPHRTMSEVAPLVRREVGIDPEDSYTELGVRSFYKGAFHRRTVKGEEFTWQKMFRVEQGDLIFSNIMAWEQAIALAGAEDHGCLGNHRMLTCVANRKVMLPQFLAYYFTTEEGFADVYAASPGTAARNRTLIAFNLEAIKVPVPPLDAQRAFTKLQAAVVALKAKHFAIRASNEALVPAVLRRVFAE